MSTAGLAQIRDCVAQGNRAAALSALRAAINGEKIGAREGVEVMLAVRQGSPAMVAEAIAAMEWGVTGTYRFVPQTNHVAA